MFFLILTQISLLGEWKPIFINAPKSKQRISIMQLAFDNEIYLLDLLNFFRTCQTDQQQRLAHRLFNNEHVTLLCKCSLACFLFKIKPQQNI